MTFWGRRLAKVLVIVVTVGVIHMLKLTDLHKYSVMGLLWECQNQWS